MTTTAVGTEVKSRPVLRRGLLATVLAAGACVLTYLVARAIGIPLELSLQREAPPALLPIEMVVVASVAGALGGTALYMLLRRIGPGSARTFRIVGLVFLLLSLAAPLTVGGADASTRIALMLMHVVAGASIIGVLSRADGR